MVAATADPSSAPHLLHQAGDPTAESSTLSPHQYHQVPRLKRVVTTSSEDAVLFPWATARPNLQSVSSGAFIPQHIVRSSRESSHKNDDDDSTSHAPPIKRSRQSSERPGQMTTPQQSTLHDEDVGSDSCDATTREIDVSACAQHDFIPSPVPFVFDISQQSTADQSLRNHPSEDGLFIDALLPLLNRHPPFRGGSGRQDSHSPSQPSYYSSHNNHSSKVPRGALCLPTLHEAAPPTDETCNSMLDTIPQSSKVLGDPLNPESQREEQPQEQLVTNSTAAAAVPTGTSVSAGIPQPASCSPLGNFSSPAQVENTAAESRGILADNAPGASPREVEAGSTEVVPGGSTKYVPVRIATSEHKHFSPDGDLENMPPATLVRPQRPLFAALPPRRAPLEWSFAASAEPPTSVDDKAAVAKLYPKMYCGSETPVLNLNSPKLSTSSCLPFKAAVVSHAAIASVTATFFARCRYFYASRRVPIEDAPLSPQPLAGKAVTTSTTTADHAKDVLLRKERRASVPQAGVKPLPRQHQPYRRRMSGKTSEDSSNRAIRVRKRCIDSDGSLSGHEMVDDLLQENTTTVDGAAATTRSEHLRNKAAGALTRAFHDKNKPKVTDTELSDDAGQKVHGRIPRSSRGNEMTADGIITVANITSAANEIISPGMPDLSAAGIAEEPSKRVRRRSISPAPSVHRRPSVTVGFSRTGRPHKHRTAPDIAAGSLEVDSTENNKFNTTGTSTGSKEAATKIETFAGGMTSVEDLPRIQRKAKQVSDKSRGDETGKTVAQAKHTAVNAKSAARMRRRSGDPHQPSSLLEPIQPKDESGTAAAAVTANAEQSAEGALKKAESAESAESMTEGDEDSQPEEIREEVQRWEEQRHQTTQILIQQCKDRVTLFQSSGRRLPHPFLHRRRSCNCPFDEIVQQYFDDDGFPRCDLSEIPGKTDKKNLLYLECCRRNWTAPVTVGFNDKGRAVFAAAELLRDDFICEYKGKILLTAKDIARAEKINQGFHGCYMYYFKNPHCNDQICIDATDEDPKFGFARLINHSKRFCNTGVVAIFDEWACLTRLIFFAKKTIKANEELLIDYADTMSTNAFPWLKE